MKVTMNINRLARPSWSDDCLNGKEDWTGLYKGHSGIVRVFARKPGLVTLPRSDDAGIAHFTVIAKGMDFFLHYDRYRTPKGCAIIASRMLRAIDSLDPWMLKSPQLAHSWFANRLTAEGVKL